MQESLFICFASGEVFINPTLCHTMHLLVTTQAASQLFSAKTIEFQLYFHPCDSEDLQVRVYKFDV